MSLIWFESNAGEKCIVKNRLLRIGSAKVHNQESNLSTPKRIPDTGFDTPQANLVFFPSRESLIIVGHMEF